MSVSVAKVCHCGIRLQRISDEYPQRRKKPLYHIASYKHVTTAEWGGAGEKGGVPLASGLSPLLKQGQTQKANTSFRESMLIYDRSVSSLLTFAHTGAGPEPHCTW